MSALDVKALGVTYDGRHGPVTALADFSLTVPDGHMMVLLGESGCGKSTALNAIAGLVEPNAGLIQLGDDILFSTLSRHVRSTPPNRRDIGMVFQSYALWPHLSVLDNVMYPLRRRGHKQTEAKALALSALETVRCHQLADRFPGELSGGQQQRIALARALVGKPKLLLFDEPLSNLDASLRRGLRDELARLHREIGFTGLYVTHDQSEALSLGSAVAVMDRGKILQFGTPQQIYEHPQSEFVARFFGANIAPGRAMGKSPAVETPLGVLECASAPPAGPVSVSFMPQAATLEPVPDGPLRVASVLYLGSHREVRLIGAGCEALVVESASGQALPPDTRVRLKIAAKDVHAFAAGTKDQ